MNFEKIYSILIEILEKQENVSIKVDIERKWERMKKLKEIILGTSIIWMPIVACYLCGIIEKILG